MKGLKILMFILRRAFGILLLCTLLLVAGCDRLLNLSPPDELAEDQIWTDARLVEAYLIDVYNDTGVGYGDPMVATGVTDEAVNTHGHGDGPIVTSNLTPDDKGIWFQPGWRSPGSSEYRHYHWPSIFSTLRDLNILIEGVGGSETLVESTRETLLGEAYFLRAYFYHNLLKLYGGVPLVDHAFELGQDMEDFQVPRSSFEETVDFIVADLDRATERLSMTGRWQGAATRGAALALKSRVLLFAASDLYNENPSGMDETGYTAGSQRDRWQQAKDAAEAVINLGAYSLDPAPTAEEYHQLLVDGGGSETIWARYFSPDGGFAPDHVAFVSPNGYSGWGGDTPAQNHVDAYDMKDGSQFEWGNPEHAAHPYTNRDPRLSANVLYNGMNWRERPAGVANQDPIGVYQSGWYEMPGQDDLRPGLDTREGPLTTYNGTRTGYNLRKFVDPSVLPGQEQAYTPWIHLRYAEVLLNFAEASAELGDIDDAQWALREVRARVGMPDASGSDRELIDDIRNERQVELAFEGHRYFDVRRWMIGPEAYEDAKGIRITGHLDESGELLVEHRYRYEHEVITVQERNWDDRNYFLPIHRDAINTNPNLVQNPGY